MNYKIIEVTNNRLLKEFIDLPYKLYKDDPNFVPFIKLYTKQSPMQAGNNRDISCHNTVIPIRRNLKGSSRYKIPACAGMTSYSWRNT